MVRLPRVLVKKVTMFSAFLALVRSTCTGRKEKKVNFGRLNLITILTEEKVELLEARLSLVTEEHLPLALGRLAWQHEK